MDIFEALRAAADPQKAVQMSAYMRDQFPFLGIPTQERKKLTKECLKQMDKESLDWDFVMRCWKQPEREFQYVACQYLVDRKVVLSPNDIPQLKILVIEKSWWDTIDALDTLFGDIALRYPEVNKTLLEWSVDDSFWLRRIAIDHQLQRKDKTDTALLEQIIVNNLGQTEFFINKAIGWALRDYSKTDPEWVRSFVERYQDELAPLSIREASKHL